MRFAHQAYHLPMQCWDVVLDGISHSRVVDRVVAVDKYVSKRDDPPCIRDACRGLRIQAHKTVEGFADDFKVAFNGGA